MPESKYLLLEVKIHVDAMAEEKKTRELRHCMMEGALVTCLGARFYSRFVFRVASAPENKG